MMGLAPEHLKMREHIFNGMSPEFEKALTEREWKIIDKVIEECFYFMRGDWFDGFHAGINNEKPETTEKD
jgi:hypothetical protein